VNKISSDTLRLWEGRPGFLLDFAHKRLRHRPSTESQLEQALKDEKHAVVADIKSKLSLLEFRTDPTVLQTLHYLLRMHNGISQNEVLNYKLIEAGLACQEGSSAVVCEELIREYVLSQTPAWNQIEMRMVRYHGSKYSDLGVRAVALQLL
jgi:hypothetical protein